MNELQSITTEEEAKTRRRALSVEDLLPGFTLWKEASGQYRWFTFYSNNFRDDDHPSEIISKESHERFVEMVDKGIVDYPELWLWHVPVAWGKADWLAYTDGLALASGTVFPEYNHVAEALSKEKGLATSHGMPKTMVVYDDRDKSVIRFHITKEISPLPLSRAANKRTGFLILKDVDMPLDADKRDWLINTAKLKPEFVKSLEDQIDAVAAQAKADGVETKEVSADPAATPAPTVPTPAVPAPAVPPTPTPAPTPAPAVPPTQPAVPAGVPVTPPVPDDPKSKEVNFVTRDELAALLPELLNPLIQSNAALVKQVDSLTKELKQVQASDASKIALLKEATPPLSLRDMITRNLIGSPAAKLKEGDPLAEDKPKETPAPTGHAPTIVPFVNGIVAAQHS